MKVETNIKILFFFIICFLISCVSEKEQEETKIIDVYFSMSEIFNENTILISIHIDLNLGEITYSGKNGEKQRIRTFLQKKNLSQDERLQIMDAFYLLPEKINVIKKLSFEEKNELNSIYKNFLTYNISDCGMTLSEGYVPVFVKIILREGKTFIFYLDRMVETTDRANAPYHPLKHPNIYGEYLEEYRFGFENTPMQELLILLKEIFAKELHTLFLR